MAPVLIFVYNRLEHTISTIEALSKNLNAKETEVFIFSDGAKNASSEKSVNMVRNYIDNVKSEGHFKNVQIFKSLDNKGLANSIIEGVTQIINEYGKVIVLEDDLVSSKNFINYMNEALDFYESNHNIWSISGYNIPIQIPDTYHPDVYLSYRGCSWGWATWKNRWDLVDWNINDYMEFCKDKSARKSFNLGGRDLAFMLDDQVEGRIDSWAIRWCYSQSKLRRYTVYPVQSMIKNIGLDGSGTHNGNTKHYDTELPNDITAVQLMNIEFNQIILDRFQNHYMTNRYYFEESIKRKIKKLLGR